MYIPGIQKASLWYASVHDVSDAPVEQKISGMCHTRGVAAYLSLAVESLLSHSDWKQKTLKPIELIMQALIRTMPNTVHWRMWSVGSPVPFTDVLFCVVSALFGLTASGLGPLVAVSDVMVGD